MSNQVFPSLPGLSWSVIKTPEWSTTVHKAVSGKELRGSLRAYPVYLFTLSYEFLRQQAAFPEIQSLLGFFNARQGAFDNFLYTDPNDYTVTNENIGTGNGSTTGFQLTRSQGGFIEPVMNLNGNPTVKVNGVTKTLGGDYTISSTGFITFSAPPPNTHQVVWTGSYYYRCRFDEDMNDFENFMNQLWTLKKLVLRGSLGSKI